MLRRKLKKALFNKQVALFVFLESLVALDALIKGWVNVNVSYPIIVWENFWGIDFVIQCVTNRGGAWGFFASFHKPLLIFLIFIILGISIYLFVKPLSIKKRVALILILAGAMGNVIDSFVYGHVIDMFHFIFWGHSYGIFNLADAMIFLGGFSLLFMGHEKRRLQSL